MSFGEVIVLWRSGEGWHLRATVCLQQGISIDLQELTLNQGACFKLVD